MLKIHYELKLLEMLINIKNMLINMKTMNYEKIIVIDRYNSKYSKK